MSRTRPKQTREAAAAAGQESLPLPPEAICSNCRRPLGGPNGCPAGGVLCQAPRARSEEAEYAEQIRDLIRCGLSGEAFAHVLLASEHADHIRTAATNSFEAVVGWFTRDPDAAAILRPEPGFESFARAFYQEALRLCPPPELPGLPS